MPLVGGGDSLGFSAMDIGTLPRLRTCNVHQTPHRCSRQSRSIRMHARVRTYWRCLRPGRPQLDAAPWPGAGLVGRWLSGSVSEVVRLQARRRGLSRCIWRVVFSTPPPPASLPFWLDGWRGVETGHPLSSRSTPESVPAPYGVRSTLH